MEKLGMQVLATAVFAGLGVTILLVGYWVFDKINPLDFNKEIEQKNTAMAIVVAGFFIAIALIIAATIHAP